MFFSYEVIAAFGVSAVLSFLISATVLLVIVAKRGVFRAGVRKQQALLQARPVLTTTELSPLNKQHF